MLARCIYPPIYVNKRPTYLSLNVAYAAVVFMADTNHMRVHLAFALCFHTRESIKRRFHLENSSSLVGEVLSCHCGSTCYVERLCSEKDIQKNINVPSEYDCIILKEGEYPVVSLTTPAVPVPVQALWEADIHHPTNSIQQC